MAPLVKPIPILAAVLAIAAGCGQAATPTPRVTTTASVTTTTVVVATTSSSMVTTTSATATAAYYRTCADAEAAGVAPIERGESGYRSALDRDGDGLACDQ